MPVSKSTTTPVAKVPAGEWRLILGLLVVLFGFDLLTYNLSPTVWCDDVSFTEPAINYLKYGTYTSTVWQFQPLNAFPSVNCPLYSQAIIGWLWLFGTDLLAVRTFNYFLMAGACLLFWLLLHKFDLVRSARWRLALVTAFHLGYGMSFAYRCSRPDTLGLVLTLALGLVFTVKANRWRDFGLLALAITLPWVSLNCGLYAGLACFFGLTIIRRIKLGQALLVWSGLIVGVLSVAGFLSLHGALKNFLTGASHIVGKHYEATAGAGILTRVLNIFRATLPSYFLDYSTAVLLLGTIILLLLRWRELKACAAWRIIIGSTLLLFATPLLFNFVGHYAFYYSYTIFTPALILFGTVALSAASQPEQQRRFTNAIAALTLLGATLVGLPLRLAASTYFGTITPRAELQKRVNASISTNDVVYADDAAFFEVKQRAKVVYVRWSFMEFVGTPVPGRRLTPADKDSVTKLVIRAEHAEFFTNTFGGQWQAVTEPFGDLTRWERVESVPLIQTKLRRYLDQPQTWRYPLQIFQRIPTPRPERAITPSKGSSLARLGDAFRSNTDANQLNHQ